MPAAPSWTPPVAAAPAAPAGAPFTDAKGLVEFAMAAYKDLGPDKGAGIQSAIAHLGHQNINDVRPDQYTQFAQMVTSLRG